MTIEDSFPICLSFLPCYYSATIQLLFSFYSGRLTTHTTYNIHIADSQQCALSLRKNTTRNRKCELSRKETRRTSQSLFAIVEDIIAVVVTDIVINIVNIVNI